MPRGIGGLFRRAEPAPPPLAPAPARVVLVVHQETKGVVRTLNRLADTRDPDNPVDTVVIANGSPAPTLAEIEARRARLPDLQVVPLRTRRTLADAVAEAVTRANADVLVFLAPGTEPQPGWLPPLLDALADPAVRGAAPVVRALDGTVVAAGLAFARGRSPEPFLAGFPADDAAFLRDHPVAAVSGPAVAFRGTDLATVGGPRDDLGPLGWADVSLRLTGTFRVCPDSAVVVRNPAVPTPAEADTFVQRWPDGPDTADELWGRAGFDLTPALHRRPIEVREGRPQLRWAIKNPATPLGWGERWGDTHFCRRLAEALRRLGQTVVIDHRGAFDRPTGRFDDVTLVVRGLTPHTPTPGAVNLAWLISHPEEMTAAEAASYDRLFAAGPSWAREHAAAWGVRIDPLLQATDAELFSPDRAEPDTGHRVLFVGSARDGSRDIVRLASAAGLAVTAYGGGWQGHLPDDRIAGEFLANTELGAAYRSAGVVLNDHWPDMRAGGFLSNRLFDAAAAGARVVTDDVADLDGLFGRSVQVARTADDVARLVGDLSVFGDDAERRAVAARIRAEHSFDARARVLLDAAIELRSSGDA
jgi:hypothetical protein